MGFARSMGENVPCMRDDYVVEWRMLLSEACEPDSDDHFYRGRSGGGRREDWGTFWVRGSTATGVHVIGD